MLAEAVGAHAQYQSECNVLVDGILLELNVTREKRVSNKDLVKMDVAVGAFVRSFGSASASDLWAPKLSPHTSEDTCVLRSITVSEGFP